MLWIDTDMGFDDIWAVLVAAARHDIAGMSLVAGNTGLAQVRRNAAGAAALFDWRFPVYSGAEKAILGHGETAAHVLGPTGLPTRGRALPEAAAPPPARAFDALAAWLEGLREPGEILALGPLTNIAVLALARPDLVARIGRLTWMGGGATSGNHTASAEFNAYADPEALAVVLDAGVPMRVIDLDLCRQVLIAPADVAPLKAIETRRGGILADLLGAYVDIALTRQRPAMALYDPTAAVAAIDPEAVVFAPARVAVECAGALTRGRTVVDRRPQAKPNVEWGIDVDAVRVRDMALGTLAEVARA